MISRLLCLASFIAKERAFAEANSLLLVASLIDDEYVRKLDEEGKLGYSEDGKRSEEDYEIEEHYQKEHPNIYDLIAYYVWSPSKAKAKGFNNLFEEGSSDPRLKALEKLITESRQAHPGMTTLYRASTSPDPTSRVVESWTDSFKWAKEWGRMYLSEFDQYYVLEAQVPRDKIQLSYLAVAPLSNEREILVDSRDLPVRVIDVINNKE